MLRQQMNHQQRDEKPGDLRSASTLMHIAEELKYSHSLSLSHRLSKLLLHRGLAKILAVRTDSQ